MVKRSQLAETRLGLARLQLISHQANQLLNLVRWLLWASRTVSASAGFQSTLKDKAPKDKAPKDKAPKDRAPKDRALKSREKGQS